MSLLETLKAERAVALKEEYEATVKLMAAQDQLTNAKRVIRDTTKRIKAAEARLA